MCRNVRELETAKYEEVKTLVGGGESDRGPELVSELGEKNWCEGKGGTRGAKTWLLILKKGNRRGTTSGTREKMEGGNMRKFP